MKMYLTKAGTYVRTKAEAGKGHMAVDVPTDARGLIDYLNGVMGSLPAALAEAHPLMTVEDQPLPQGPTIMRDPSGRHPDVPLSSCACSDPTKRSVMFDEVFPTLPLGHQLHFAAMAMENARERL